MMCPYCCSELVTTPNRERLKDSFRWYNCNSCKNTWKIYRAIKFYKEKKQ